MVLVVVTVTLGIVAGYLRGGRLRRLADVPLGRVWLLGVAIAAQVLVGVLGGTASAPVVSTLLLVSQAALVAFVWANRILPGMALVAVGLGLNALVIAINGAMPVSGDAIAAVAADPVAAVAPGTHRLLGAGDALPWLADVLPVPPLRTVVSVGDVVLALGVAVLVAALMAPRGRHRRPRLSRRPAPPHDAAMPPWR